MTHAKPAAVATTTTTTTSVEPQTETVTERVQPQQQQLQEVPKANQVPATTSSAAATLSVVVLRPSTANSGE